MLQTRRFEIGINTRYNAFKLLVQICGEQNRANFMHLTLISTPLSFRIGHTLSSYTHSMQETTFLRP